MRTRALLVGACILIGLVAPVATSSPASAADAPPPAIPAFAKVSTALRHSCAATTAGGVWCWGSNTGSILGSTTLVEAHYPVEVDLVGSALDGETVVDLDAGVHTTCAVAASGKVGCWGGSRFNTLGNGSTTASATPVSPDFSTSSLAGEAIARVEVDTTAACAISVTGRLACWGDRPATYANDLRPRDVPTTGTVLDGKAIREVDTTGDHACAVTTDGILSCWGIRQHNRIGPLATADAPTPIPVDLTGSSLEGKAIIDVSTDANRTCALASDSTVTCWGSSITGFLDLPTASTPLAGKAIVEIQVNAGTTCARTSVGGIACLGNNSFGRLGTSGGNSTTWVAPATAGTPMAGKVVADLTVGEETTCAATTQGAVNCWGENSYGEGGNETCHDHLACTAGYTTPGPPSITTISAAPRSLTVSWTAPKSSGGYPVTAYQVSVSRLFFIKTTTLAADVTSTQITGLTDGLAYTITVRAQSERGWGTPSAAGSGTPAQRPSTVAPFATWDAFTTQQFRDLEGRDPTPAELAAWSASLTADPTSKGTLVESLRLGADNTTAVDPAVRLYRAFLGRIPDAGGLRFWVNRRRTGAWTLVRIADSFSSSSEFKRKYGALTDEQFVTRIYTDVLGRNADPTGVDYWTRQLQLKRRTRGSVMVGFSESNEYKTKQANATDAAVAHVFLLGRAPTVAEEAAWVSLRTATSPIPHALLLRELLDGPAYADRISP